MGLCMNLCMYVCMHFCMYIERDGRSGLLLALLLLVSFGDFIFGCDEVNRSRRRGRREG